MRVLDPRTCTSRIKTSEMRKRNMHFHTRRNRRPRRHAVVHRFLSRAQRSKCRHATFVSIETGHKTNTHFQWIQQMQEMFLGITHRLIPICIFILDQQPQKMSTCDSSPATEDAQAQYALSRRAKQPQKMLTVVHRLHERNGPIYNFTWETTRAEMLTCDFCTDRSSAHKSNMHIFYQGRFKAAC